MTADSACQVKISYFPIEAAAEKVRLTLVMCGKEFEDNRVVFQDWGAYKPQTPYGQMPVMDITESDGTKKTFAQSDAMMRYIAARFDESGTLFPKDPEQLLLVEEVIGLSGDFARAWSPAIYLSMGFHEGMGHPKEWAEKDAVVKAMREKWVSDPDKLAKFMGFYAGKLEASGGPYFTGANITIADLVVLAQLRYFIKGVADNVPSDCLNKYTVVMKWMKTMMNDTKINAWYKGGEDAWFKGGFDAQF